MPIVSVIIPAYNHEEFIQECLQSVLDQTYQDFEIIITDDGSSDRTVEVIERFNDPRIKFFKFQKNQGACVAANNCIRHSSGKYIAMLSSDDAWYPQKLAVQVKYLDEHPNIAVVFGKVDWINESGNLINEVNFPYLNSFNVKNRTRFEWLRHFFKRGNCLCHPCSLVRRECYSEVGMFNPALAGLPDFDLWIRICLKYDIEILDQKLIRFRRIGEDSNASGDNVKNRVGSRFEYLQILNHYLKIKKPKELLSIFPDAARYGKVKANIIPYFLGRIAIDDGWDFKLLWGLDVIYNLMQDEELSKILNEEYNFSYQDFRKLVSESDFFRISLLSESVNLKPLPRHGNSIRKVLSASKRYAKDLYSIASDFLKTFHVVR
jgi:glycosyltransferase involved in cell wall biosynthesis